MFSVRSTQTLISPKLLRLYVDRVDSFSYFTGLLQAFIYPRCLIREKVFIKRCIHYFKYLSSCGPWTHNKRIAEYLVLQVHELLLRQIDISKQPESFLQDLTHRVRSEARRYFGLPWLGLPTQYHALSTVRLETVVVKRRLKLHLWADRFVKCSPSHHRLLGLLI